MGKREEYVQTPRKRELVGERKKVRVNEGDREEVKRETFKESKRERERERIFIY